MPQLIGIDGGKYSVATEEELLAFANSVRATGGANVLEALLPSRIGEPTACLIANALNFGCSVDMYGDGEVFGSGADRWAMQLPENLSEEQMAALSELPDCELRSDPYAGCKNYSLLLPEHIGNAALAFDRSVAFQEYAE